MKKLLLILLAVIPLNVFLMGMSSVSPEFSCKIRVAHVESIRYNKVKNEKRHINKKFKFKRKKTFKANNQTEKMVLLILGFLMSIVSLFLLVFVGTGGQVIGPFILGFFGALLCLLSISNETNKWISIIGLVMGVIGGLGTVISVIYRSS